MHTNNFMYELDVNENGEIVLLFEIDGVKYTLVITEKDAKAFVHLFKMHNQK